MIIWAVNKKMGCCKDIPTTSTLRRFTIIKIYVFIYGDLSNWVQSTVLWVILFTHRNSHCRCSIRKGVLRNLSKFTGKRLCQSLYFNKVAECFCQYRGYYKFSPGLLNFNSFLKHSNRRWFSNIYIKLTLLYYDLKKIIR